MKKRFSVILLALLMVFAFAGCSDRNDNNTIEIVADRKEDNIEDGVDDVKDDVRDGVDDARDNMDNTGDNLDNNGDNMLNDNTTKNHEPINNNKTNQ